MSDCASYKAWKLYIRDPSEANSDLAMPFFVLVRHDATSFRLLRILRLLVLHILAWCAAHGVRPIVCGPVRHDLRAFGSQGAVTSEGFHSLCDALEELVIEGFRSL